MFFGRFVSILRTCAAPWPAPAARVGANSSWQCRQIVWAGIYTLAAYLAGNALQHASHTIDYSIDGVAVLAVTGVIVEGRHQTARLGQQAETASPGSLE